MPFPTEKHCQIIYAFLSKVAALGAALAAVRGERRGGFGAELFRRVATAALGRNATGELLGVLTAKYMAFADVRWGSCPECRCKLLLPQGHQQEVRRVSESEADGCCASVLSSAGHSLPPSIARFLLDPPCSCAPVRRYHALVAVQSLAGQVAAGADAGGGAGDAAEATAPLFEVLIRTPPTPPAENFAADLQSWSGAAEASSLSKPPSFAFCWDALLRLSYKDRLNRFAWMRVAAGVA